MLRRTAPAFPLVAFPAAVACLLAAGCRPGETDPTTAPADSPALRAGALAADQPTAQEIGEAILADGGSAADAAVAAVFALGVENPSSSGLGGGGFAVVWDAASRRAYALDFRERAPAGASAGHYRGPDGAFDPERSQRGCYAAGVPGEVAGLGALHGRFGRLEWSRVVRPAQLLASHGWSVSPYLAKALEDALGGRRDEHGAGEDAAQAADRAWAGPYLRPDGRPSQEGEVLRDPELASTLEAIATHGPEAFYRGSIAAAIDAACRDFDGAVRAADLADYAPIWRTPIVTHWRSFRIVGMPPPSSGGTVLAEALETIEPLPFNREGADAGGSYHLLAESLKHGFADRARYFGDPEFVRVPTERLLSPAYAELRRRSIDASRTQPSWAYGLPGVRMKDDAGTSHVSVVDARGNAVAITSSVNGLFGARVRAPRAGVLLNNTLDDFSLDDAPNLYGLVGSKKNRIAPGKRPVSSMAPTVVLERGAGGERVRVVAGGAGGPRIISATLQTILGVLAERATVEEAVDAPRLHHQWMPDTLYLEPSISQRVADALAERGHLLTPAPFLAAVNAVEVRDGRAVGASDPRKRRAGD